VERAPAGATVMPDLMRRYAGYLCRSHAGDSLVLPDDPD
jgi:hypothetical protein